MAESNKSMNIALRSHKDIDQNTSNQCTQLIKGNKLIVKLWQPLKPITYDAYELTGPPKVMT